MKWGHSTPIKYKKDKEGEHSEKKESEPYLTKVTIQIRNTGKYVVSQIPNVNSLKFDKDKSKRIFNLILIKIQVLINIIYHL